MKHFGPRRQRYQYQLMASMTPMPTAVVYSATKFCRHDHARAGEGVGTEKIRVNAINPGGVETEGTHSMGVIGSDFEKQMVARTPLGRLGRPNDIAPVAVFLASAASGGMTGERSRSAAASREPPTVDHRAVGGAGLPRPHGDFSLFDDPVQIRLCLHLRSWLNIVPMAVYGT